MTVFHIFCFPWHCLCHSVSIIKVSFHVFAFEIRNYYDRLKKPRNTYSTAAETLSRPIHTNEGED